MNYWLIAETRRLEIASIQMMSTSVNEDGIWRWNLQPAEAGFVCVDAVSTAGFLNFVADLTDELLVDCGDSAIGNCVYTNDVHLRG